MKQVLQQARDGSVAVVEVPVPQLLPGCVLVRVAASLVSAGTERASTEFAGKNLWQKAQARPDLVREVISKVKRDGLLSAIHAVNSRLDQPGIPGYSSSGTVVEVGGGITDLAPGDRVACAGAGYAAHAEVACVPRLLTAKIASNAVSFDEAAFATVGAVVLHGVRTADVRLGDCVAVVGLGLLGQLIVQVLKSAGCRVLGMDPQAERAALAIQLGAEAACSTEADFRELCLERSGGRGADSVLITAETPSSGPVNLAAEVARDRAIITAVGTVGMELDRKLYYGKELEFRVSRSYGPGRYDSAYEQKGRDYPLGYVRWTETRNMEAFLQLLADGKLDLKALISHRIPIERASEAYDVITGKAGKFLGVLISYPETVSAEPKLQLVAGGRRQSTSGAVRVGLLGAGTFALGTLLPEIKAAGRTELVSACAATGPKVRHLASKFGFRDCTTDDNALIHSADINCVVIATRHHLHAQQTVAALNAGKHVFCEKPLCLNEDELVQIVRAARASSALLMVGFNRRFAPMALRLKDFVRQIGEPLAMHYRVNAGYLPADHWVNDPEVGGGRILGEVCHFVDFLSFVSGSPPMTVQTRMLPDRGRYSGDNVVIDLEFANGSQGTIHYLANGDRSYSKERIEVFGGGRAAVLGDFRLLELVNKGRKQVVRSRLKQDKGHRAEWHAFAAAVREGRESPIAFEEIVASTLATLRAESSRQSGRSESVDTAAILNSDSLQR